MDLSHSAAASPGARPRPAAAARGVAGAAARAPISRGLRRGEWASFAPVPPGMEGRVLFIGGLPWDAPAAAVAAAISNVCPASTHVAIKDPHRGWALAAFRCAAAAAGGAAALAGAAAAGAPALGPRLTVAPAERVPASWPAEWTMSDEEVAEAALQRERAERHHAHLKRRRQRQRGEMIDTLEGLLEGLTRSGALPRGGDVWAEYTPLLSDLAAQWRGAAAAGGDAAGGGSVGGESGGGGGGGGAALAAVLGSMPPRLRGVVRPERLLQELEAAWEAVPRPAAAAGPIALAPAPSAADVAAALWFDWSKLPPEVDPAFGGQLADADVIRAGDGPINLRALRKRVQVEGFALALLQLLPRVRAARRRAARGAGAGAPNGSSGGGGGGEAGGGGEEPIWVVDFGSGGGNLTLPLAWLFEEAGCRFVAVDYKAAAVAIVSRRAAAAGLAGLSAVAGRIEDYEGPADVVLALHACGAATDFALQQAAARRAAAVVSPCCIGKVNLAPLAGAEGGDGGGAARLPPLRRPRSRRLAGALAALRPPGGAAAAAPDDAAPDAAPDPDAAAAPGSDAAAAARLFASLARVADFSHTEGHGYPALAAAAKAAVELDRALGLGEAGYEWRLARLPAPELTAKSDVIAAWPREG
ncbi:MAG: methyltransferase domain-containing protein [Monoraphidium minutum]|nr:MAG: methyltransferase domain-containing protein [Monoraphidium minutum]